MYPAATASRCAAPTPCMRRPYATLARTVSQGSADGSWKTIAVSALRSRLRRISVVPPSGVSRPARMRRSVDFPHPLGPTSTHSSPSRTSRSSLPSASTRPKRVGKSFRTPRTAILTPPFSRGEDRGDRPAVTGGPCTAMRRETPLSAPRGLPLRGAAAGGPGGGRHENTGSMAAPPAVHLWAGWPHVLRAQQFDPGSLDCVFREARLAEEIINSGGSNLLKGKIILTLFYEPSTRTRLSFEFATYHLGGRVLSSEAAREFSSAAKGESIEDTIRVACRYRPAAIVIRHYEEGAAERAAAAATDPRTGRPVPVFNAGDGPGQHPTQALLDAYTIWRVRGTLDGASVAVAGDLLNGRTARSLCYLLAKYPGVSFRLIAPRAVQMKEDLLAYLRRHKVPVVQTEDLAGGIRGARVRYAARVQKERFGGEW